MSYFIFRLLIFPCSKAIVKTSHWLELLLIVTFKVGPPLKDKLIWSKLWTGAGEGVGVEDIVGVEVGFRVGLKVGLILGEAVGDELTDELAAGEEIGIADATGVDWLPIFQEFKERKANNMPKLISIIKIKVDFLNIAPILCFEGSAKSYLKLGPTKR